jgi:hypothetical protein
MNNKAASKFTCIQKFSGKYLKSYRKFAFHSWTNQTAYVKNIKNTIICKFLLCFKCQVFNLASSVIFSFIFIVFYLYLYLPSILLYLYKWSLSKRPRSQCYFIIIWILSIYFIFCANRIRCTVQMKTKWAINLLFAVFMWNDY